MVRKYISECTEGITKARERSEGYLNRYLSARVSPAAFR